MLIEACIFYISVLADDQVNRLQINEIESFSQRTKPPTVFVRWTEDSGTNNVMHTIKQSIE